ncbi:MAG: hypothetical protein RL885_29910 [Planctomycetota bacterium]
MSVDIRLYVLELAPYLQLWERSLQGDDEAEEEWTDFVEELEDRCDHYDSYKPVTELVDQFELKRARLEGSPEERFFRTVFWQELREPRPGLRPESDEIAGYAVLILDTPHLAELADVIRSVDVERLAVVLFEPSFDYAENAEDVASYLAQFTKAMRLALDSGLGFVWEVIG